MFFPISDDNPSSSTPYVTYLLIGLCSFVFVLQFLGFGNTEASIQEMKEPVNNLVLFICIIGPILNIGGLTFIYFYTITRDEFESAVKDLGY